MGRRPSVSLSGGSSHSHSSYSSSMDMDTSESSSFVSHGRCLTWGWKAGWLVESTGGSVKVRLADMSEDIATVSLDAHALQAGQVVLCNDYETDHETGAILPPHDLITLTHLHEPSVVESLQHRYQQDKIYTATGPVLLALNPFQNVRGVYGEAVMKKYWDRAEKCSEKELPPHVYAIADNSFRNMMRGLEDCIGNADYAESNGNSATINNPKCNQSILVSGESGAGKTVTTKFVMKYLAALSQRSTVLNEAPVRAYKQVQDHRASDTDGPTGGTRASPFAQPSWAVAARSKSKAGGAEAGSNGNSSSGLAGVTVLAGTKSNSIEAQVLQSNPILESFGNARTVRNDNSSRFGKFIEIQFTSTGKLVGANVETYLLEKVRLVTQSAGERNYHIFFELLSGAMDSRELSQFYLAPTARPDDFIMTAAGTYDRRDGVTDKETYRQLRTAMSTMKFSVAEQKQVFSVTAAILHSSNLTFGDLPGEESALDDQNVHLVPVCNLLGVTFEDLNQSLCYFSITAGNQTVQRALTRAKAEKGLEALLKATYGALFSYLVKRINDSISYKAKRQADEGEEGDEGSVDSSKPSEDAIHRPAASIGVLDIFGFESFTKNSFEQLCINYCNEALQQQFNAFVLKNEQAEYEREGIEWSFIEFPENQDVLDLIEKRGVGILSILDDQCRAPGPSDKAFALDVYSKCKGQSRLTASRKQTATLQFSVHHYAGPVEYSSDGFTEKNRDELPKETVELLKHSDIPFIQELARIMDSSHEVSSDSKTGATPTPTKLHRADSSVGRATVGGQFRLQLRNLRIKIDATSPHYVRCLKPNDHLVPNQFDTAIVAEQLRCGGILEAVRVARAGFTQHYPHADFVRRYRTLAWREMGKKDVIHKQATGVATNNRGATTKGVRSSYKPNSSPVPQPEISKAESKAECTDLLKVLYRKLQKLEREDESEGQDSVEGQSLPTVKAKTYSPLGASPIPSWTKAAKKAKPTGASSSPLPPVPGGGGSITSRYTPWKEKSTPKKEITTPPPGGSWNRRGLTLSDYGKVGIQMGKTKVFLRHNAFEALERIRSREQTEAAAKLNATFRMYLARCAYIPYRNAFRREIHDRRQMFEKQDEYKETKEQDYEDDGVSTFKFHSALSFYGGNSFDPRDSLVNKWMESQIRDAIHNPVPRHEWGKQAPATGIFEWAISEGIWVKNHY